MSYPSDDDLDREQSPPHSGSVKKQRKSGPDIFRDATATYDYVSEEGTLLYQVARDAQKNFAQRRPRVGRDPGESEWIYETKDVRRVLYRLPEVKVAIAHHHRIYLVEGEKDADSVSKLGLIATTAAMGAKAPWLHEYTDQLAGAAVVIIPDNDKPGRERVAAVALALNGKVASLRVLTLPVPKEGGDASDWIDAGGTRDQLEALADGVPLYADPVKRFKSIAVGMPDFLKRKIDKPIAILGGVFSAGEVGAIVGRGGAGKSWFALQVGRAIARGESFIGLGTPTGGVRVGILELEDHAYHYQQRLAAIAASSGGCDERDENLEIVTRPDLQGAVRIADQDTIAAIIEWIEASGLRVLIVDALKDAHVSNENDNQQMALLMETLKLIAERTRCAIIFLAHEPKPTSDGKERDDVASIRGAARQGDDCRYILRLVEHKSGPRKMVFAKVSHGARPSPIWLVQDRETGVFSQAEAPEVAKNRNVEKVRLALVQAGRNGLTVAGIVEDTRLSKSTIHDHLKTLHAVSNGGKPPRYRLPSEPSESEASDDGSSSEHNDLGDFDASASESGDFPPSGVRTVRPKGRTGRTDARTETGRPDEQTNFPFSTGEPQ